MSRLYILYDSRACGAQGTENASVLEVCEDYADAKSARGMYGGMACYSYEKGPNATLIDERWEWDWYPKERSKKRKKKQPDN